MFEKCSACGTRIVAGGESFLDRRFCGENCACQFKTALVEEAFPAEAIAQQVQTVFAAPCPQCGGSHGNDIHSSTRITGMLLAYRIQSGSALCCSTCGKKNRLSAAFYCLIF